MNLTARTTAHEPPPTLRRSDFDHAWYLSLGFDAKGLPSLEVDLRELDSAGRLVEWLEQGAANLLAVRDQIVQDEQDNAAMAALLAETGGLTC